MSSNVMSAGVMVPLSRNLDYDERFEITEELYEQGSNVSINYEGTLAYTDVGADEYGITFGAMPRYEGETAFQDLVQFGLFVDGSKARPYKCLWYNGSDSDMDMMTLQDFLVETKQSG